MIRIVLFLVSLAVIATGVAWIADRPGEVAITWMGYRIETSVMVAAFADRGDRAHAHCAWSIMRAHFALARTSVAVFSPPPRRQRLSRHHAAA